MSTIETNTVKPISGSSTLTLGESGDTVSLGAGVTAGTGLTGTTINNNADNRVITGSGTANTLEGEANLTYNGSNLGVNIASPTMIAGTGMHLTSSGSDCRLHISNNTVGDTANDGGYIFMGSDGALGILNKENAPNVFYTNGSEAMRIDPNGQLLINTATTVSTDSVLQVVGNSNTTVSTYKVHTNGNTALLFRNAAGDSKGSIVINADTTSYNTTSDYRLKENVDYTFDATTRLKQLKPARFNWISDETNTLVDGFIAHEVSSVIPEAVSGDKDAMEVETRYTADDVETQGDNPSKNVGDPKTYSTTEINPQGIDQSKLVPLLTKALQEAITKIETLEAKVQTLESV